MRLLESQYPKTLILPAEEEEEEEEEKEEEEEEGGCIDEHNDDDYDNDDDDDYKHRSLPSLDREADVALVSALRRDDAARRLASLAMRPYVAGTAPDANDGVAGGDGTLSISFFENRAKCIASRTLIPGNRMRAFTATLTFFSRALSFFGMLANCLH